MTYEQKNISQIEGGLLEGCNGLVPCFPASYSTERRLTPPSAILWQGCCNKNDKISNVCNVQQIKRRN